MKKLADYRDPDGDGYLDESECHWDDAEDFIQGGLLKMCCCGDPNSNLRYIHGALKVIHERSESNTFDSPMEEWKARSKAIDDYFPDERSRMFFLYWTDSLNLTEHGSTVNGLWLADKGQQLLALLEEWIESLDKEEEQA